MLCTWCHAMASHCSHHAVTDLCIAQPQPQRVTHLCLATGNCWNHQATTIEARTQAVALQTRVTSRVGYTEQLNN
jgi:hypothetical protein